MNARINGVNMAYTDDGRGMPIVFVHAFPFGKVMWESQVKGLSEQFRVIAVDLRGHGESDAPICRYTMEQFADDLNSLLDHLSLTQAVMAGLSMGGDILFAFFREKAPRVKAPILADPRAPADTGEGKTDPVALAPLAREERPRASAPGL